MKNYKKRNIFFLLIFFIMLCPFSVMSAVLDWDINTWPSPVGGTPTLTQTYSVAGSNINVTISGDTAQLNTTGNPASPESNQFLTGGTASENALFLRTDFVNTTQRVIITIDFTHPGGVSDVSFTAWDLDATSPQWIDRVRARAVSNGANVNPSSISDGVTNSPGTNTSTGFPTNANAASNSADGNATFTFNQTNITRLRIIYNNVTTGTPGNQWISIHDVNFDVRPTVTKQLSPNPINPGQVSILTINLENDDTNPATLTANLVDTLPAGVTVASPANIGGTCTGTGSGTVNATAGGGAVTYTNGSTIPSGGCTISVDVTSSTLGTATNTINAGALQTNHGTNPAAASADLVVNPFVTDLVITKTDSSLTYTPGGTGTYVLTITNNGPDAVTAASIQDTLPDGVTLSAQWSCSATTSSSCSAASGGSIGGSAVSLTADIINGGVITVTVPVQFSANMGDY